MPPASLFALGVCTRALQLAQKTASLIKKKLMNVEHPPAMHREFDLHYH
jgi:hypothetical protein